MNKNITVILGDGIGPEVTQQSIKVLNAIAAQYNHQFQYEYHLMGADAIDKTGSPLPDETLSHVSKQMQFFSVPSAIQNTIMTNG